LASLVEGLNSRISLNGPDVMLPALVTWAMLEGDPDVR
jgi:hypothetical protein